VYKTYIIESIKENFFSTGRFFVRVNSMPF